MIVPVFLDNWYPQLVSNFMAFLKAELTSFPKKSYFLFYIYLILMKYRKKILEVVYQLAWV